MIDRKVSDKKFYVCNSCNTTMGDVINVHQKTDIIIGEVSRNSRAYWLVETVFLSVRLPALIMYIWLSPLHSLIDTTTCFLSVFPNN